MSEELQLRGGSWLYGLYDCRSAFRFVVTRVNRDSDISFRIIKEKKQHGFKN